MDTEKALALVPIVTGIVEVIKRVVPINKRFVPVLALVVALAIFVTLYGVTAEGVLGGLIAGLASSGLYSQAKTVFEEEE